MKIRWRDQFDSQGRFPRPDWELIAERVDSMVGVDLSAVWTEVAEEWLEEVKRAVSGNFRIVSSRNFRLLSPGTVRHTELLLGFLERAHKRILALLPGIASDEGYGPYVVFEFKSLDDFYDYITPEDAPEATHGMAGGVYINTGYGHFVLPHGELGTAEPVVAHEFTHACLSHLPLPLWLNEGIAVNTEDALVGSWPLRMEAEQFAKHRDFWDEETTQEFWSGAAFSRPDEGQELSYELARYSVKALAADYEVFRGFVNEAVFEDAGEAAALQHFEGSLGGLLEQFFGPGEWTPCPERWGFGSNQESTSTR